MDRLVVQVLIAILLAQDLSLSLRCLYITHSLGLEGFDLLNDLIGNRNLYVT